MSSSRPTAAGHRQTAMRPPRPRCPTLLEHGAASAVSSSTIGVSWSAVNGATSYVVFKAAAASGPYTKIGTTSSTTDNVSGMTAGGTYYFEVAAVDAGGTGGAKQLCVGGNIAGHALKRTGHERRRVGHQAHLVRGDRRHFLRRQPVDDGGRPVLAGRHHKQLDVHGQRPEIHRRNTITSSRPSAAVGRRRTATRPRRPRRRARRQD